jgi:flagellar biosynthetic protein FlhB
MAQQDESAEKSHEPTQKKLDDARKKGDIARSQDVTVALSYFGVWLFLLSIGGPQVLDFGEALTTLMENAFTSEAELLFGAGTAYFAPLFWDAGLPFLIFASIPAGIILLGLLAQRSLVFTGSKLKFKASRISVIQNAKNKFGRGGLFEFAKSFVKLTVYSVCLALFLQTHFDTVIGASAASYRGGLMVLFDLLEAFLFLVLLIAASIAAIDLGWQIKEHNRKNMMTLKELQDEAKESEGDPHLKQARRSKAQHIAMNQMLGDVPDADVVIVNPTHYAVALKWGGNKQSAPICVAKGVDEVAARIREKATEANVPIHSDPPTARALHAVVDIGEEIQPEHYAAVAVAIRFAETLKFKKRATNV